MAEPELVEPEEQLSSQAANASITADAPESFRKVRQSYRFMGVLLSIKPRTQGECARGKQGDVLLSYTLLFRNTTAVM